uniref:Uncharacterized protein n=1 Tax=Strix occidentalis caurina TaxID=311401 RepID=A0A8D0FVK3_STROC
MRLGLLVGGELLALVLGLAEPIDVVLQVDVVGVMLLALGLLPRGLLHHLALLRGLFSRNPARHAGSLGIEEAIRDQIPSPFSTPKSPSLCLGGHGEPPIPNQGNTSSVSAPSTRGCLWGPETADGQRGGGGGGEAGAGENC